jgi:hypothetical protein
MSISSTLGYFEISGQQDLDFNMDYYVRIPWKMVSEVAASKIFGKPKKQAQQEDELEMADNDGKRRRFVNVRIKGNLDNYKVSLEKAKELKGKRR